VLILQYFTMDFVLRYTIGGVWSLLSLCSEECFSSRRIQISTVSNTLKAVLLASTDTSLQVPSDLTVWEWLFESQKHSPLYSHPPDQLAGYTNASTKERINWAQVKEYATYLSTALAKKYGMQEGHTVLLFSQNTIWYPVALLAAIRAGGLNSHYAFPLSQCHPGAVSSFYIALGPHPISCLPPPSLPPRVAVALTIRLFNRRQSVWCFSSV
jgi:hypothetical protein